MEKTRRDLRSGVDQNRLRKEEEHSSLGMQILAGFYFLEYHSTSHFITTIIMYMLLILEQYLILFQATNKIDFVYVDNFMLWIRRQNTKFPRLHSSLVTRNKI